MKKIAVDCSKLNTSYLTGTHRFLINFLNELVKNKDFEFYFYVNGSGDFLKEFNFAKKGLIKSINNTSFYTQIGLLGELNKYDFFLFPWQTLPFLGFFSRCKKVAIIHDLGFSPVSRITTYFTQLTSDLVFSVSTSTAKKLFRKSIVIGEGVDEKVFYPISVKELKQVANELGIPNFFILSLGRIEKRKNIYNNLEAFAKVKKYYPNLKYIFIGNFIESEEKVYSFIKSLGLSSDDILFKKNISDKELNIYLNLMEFLVFTSFDEGFGLPVLEAYATQKPVILSKIEQLAEFKISANQFVDPNNTSKISEKMIKFLNKDHGINSKKDFSKILENYSWKKSAETFIRNLK